jgi:hypothetical protein
LSYFQPSNYSSALLHLHSTFPHNHVETSIPFQYPPLYPSGTTQSHLPRGGTNIYPQHLHQGSTNHLSRQMYRQCMLLDAQQDTSLNSAIPRPRFTPGSYRSSSGSVPLRKISGICLLHLNLHAQRLRAAPRIIPTIQPQRPLSIIHAEYHGQSTISMASTTTSWSMLQGTGPD